MIQEELAGPLGEGGVQHRRRERGGEEGNGVKR